MPAVYVVNKLDNQRASKLFFQTKKEAKIVRNELLKEGTVCVVSRGPDHPLGASFVDSDCLNKEKTSRRRSKRSRLAYAG